MSWSLRAAAFGNVYALARVVHVYWHGFEEIPRDADKAREWNAKLIAAGKPSGIPGE
jgi:TPR repeat protein